MSVALRLRSTEDIDLAAEIMIRESRKWFWAYRQFINPGMMIGWWQTEIAMQLQQFYEDLIAGKRPKLIFEAPPQHGKTKQMVDFVSWVAGKNPDYKTIYASFSDDLGVMANDMLQRIYLDEPYQKVFPKTSIGGSYRLNSTLIQYVNAEGSFINTTVNGQVTGKGLHLGIVDDPIKGRFDADSENNRNKVWNWFTDDFFTRFDKNSGLVMMLTRWHLDDPAGRLIANAPDVKMLRYPAIATQDERHRRRGEALFPQLKPLEFLLERKKIMSSGAWESEYQQNPILVGGDMFKRHWFGEPVGAAPADCQWVRRWDLAATLNDGAYTAGVLMGYSRNSKLFYVKNVVRGQYDGDGVKRLIKQTAAIDMMELGKRNYQVWLPQDPGQAGKVQARDFVNMLVGYDVHTELESGDKETRARPYAAQCEAGNVKLVQGEWIRPYLDELTQFPAGRYADQVDASSGAFGTLIMYPRQSIKMGSFKGAY